MNSREEQSYFFDMFDTMFDDTFIPGYAEISEPATYSLVNELEKLERERIVNALAFAHNNQTNAAHALNIGRTNLIAKMRKYKL